MIIFFLGRQPEFGLAEIAAVYGHQPQLIGRQLAALPIDRATALAQAQRLGSVVKMAEVVCNNWSVSREHIQSLTHRLFDETEGKITLGVSYYDPRATKKSAISLAKELQNELKNAGRSVRLVPTDGADLSTATVLHNRLAHGNPKKVEINIIKTTIPQSQATLAPAPFTKGSQDNTTKSLPLVGRAAGHAVTRGEGHATALAATTIFVQDIDAYTFRDRRRPRRDARNGMLPPKLAQTMINLALGVTIPQPQAALAPAPFTKGGQDAAAKSLPLEGRAAGHAVTRGEGRSKLSLLDPFCGTGVVLQEAALMGLAVYGTDLNEQMVENTKENLSWLARTHRIEVKSQVAAGDATDFSWRTWTAPDVINIVATETYLGRPYTETPNVNELKNNIGNCNAIISKFLGNLAKQLPKGVGLCIGVPVWFIRDHINHLPCVSEVERYGYANMTTGANLIYHRPGQIVGRELLVLQKR